MPSHDAQPRLALTVIVKDDTEAKIFERMLTSFMPFMSGLYVAVTGISGKHKKIHEIVKKFGGTSLSTNPQSHPQLYSPKPDKLETMFSNFGAARQVTFDMVEEGYDYILWADTDDMLLNGEEIVKAAKMAKNSGFDSVMFPYFYHLIATDYNDPSTITQIRIAHNRERLLKPGIFKWAKRLHEVCVPKDPNYQPHQVKYEYDPKKGETGAWAHMVDMESQERIDKILVRNRYILGIELEEEKFSDPRTIFYLAKTLFDLQEFDESAKWLEKYLEMSGWDAERATALEYLSIIYAKKKDYRKVVAILHQAIEEYPKLHSLYLRLSDAYFQLRLFPKAEHWLDVALAMPAPEPTEVVSNMFEIEQMAASLMYNKYRIRNDLPNMKIWAEKRAKVMGEDDGLLKDINDLEALNIAATGVFNLSKWLSENGYEKSVQELLKIVPEQIANQPYMSVLVNNVLTPRKWGKKEICYYASSGGQHFEQWDGDSTKVGIGGSETAVIELSKRWVKMGYKVTVFCDTDKEKEIDGVTYKPYYLINWKDKFNILILWRSPHLLQLDIKAKKLFMDLHDISSPMQWPEQFVKKIDKVFVKSAYHRSNLPNIPDSKMVVISNGINL